MTPGPWVTSEILDNGHIGVISAVTNEIIIGVPNRHPIENLGLIAAAPELLASLRAVLTAGNKPDLSAKANRDALDAAIRDGWAAIAKAEGSVCL